MEEPIPNPPTKNLSLFSEEQFVHSDTESLLKMAGVISSAPKALTASELIELNRTKVFDCVRLGVSKEQTATLLAADPRNTKALSSRTIMRDLNRVVGDWKVLTRQLQNSSLGLSPKTDGARSRDHDVHPEPRSNRQAFLDQDYNEGDVL
jgi:hypothetical protein